MKRFHPVFPLIYGAIIFLTIRIANDIPRHDDYLDNPAWFILVEFLAVCAGAYTGFYLIVAWRRICARRQLSTMAEYGIVAVGALILCGLVTMCSNGLRLFREPGHFTIPLVVSVLISLWLYLWMKSSDTARALEEARAEGLKAELEALRAQYHPHFLFNMLNTVYFLIDARNSRAREAVEDLATLLRHQIYSGEGKVTVSTEIEAVRKYVSLSLLRFGDRMHVALDIATPDPAMKIYPHLLMPLVENTFKHCTAPFEISISISQNADTLTLHTDNTCAGTSEGRYGTGLRNLKRRLELLYPGKHTFLSWREESRFLTELILKL